MWGTHQLQSGSDSARLDAELLLSYTLGRERTYLYTWPERELSAQEAEDYMSLVEQRRQGNPVAYLVGEREFWSLSLRVTPDTLIPRPETELLVEQLLLRISQVKSITTEVVQIADLGTGSGAIALAVASECPNCRVVATDRSAAALAVADINRRTHDLNNLELREGSWYQPLAGERFHLIASNPPYVEPDSGYLSDGDVRFEPRSALVGDGADGLGDLQQLIAGAAAHLHPRGWLLLEHGYRQHQAVATMMQSQGMTEVAGYGDLQGHLRVTAGRCR